jgi:hypothetical protein
MIKLFSFLAFAVLSMPVFAFNQPTELQGIKTVNVMVADLPGELLSAGVSKDALEATLESALTAAGLSVLSQGQFVGTVPTISLRVSAIREPNGRFYATDIVLDCMDNVTSRRTAGAFDALIWSKDVLQLLGAIDIGRIADGEKKLVSMFLTDYAQANQK